MTSCGERDSTGEAILEPSEGCEAGVNPYLSGLFAPVQRELYADNLKVIGTLPRDLNGAFLRNGPNPSAQTKRTYHWFDGDGMLHGVWLQNGQASYRNRFVRTISWQRQRVTGTDDAIGINDPPLEMLRHLFRSFRDGDLEYANKANTSLVWHHGHLLALWEAGLPYVVSPEDLRTLGRETFDDQWKHSFTAHPKIDPETGEMIFFGYSPLHRGIQYGVVANDGRLIHSTRVELPRLIMMHDCAVTRHYTLFLDLPMVAQPLKTWTGQTYFQFQPKYGARFGILPRHADGSETKWFEVEPCFVFHVLNAWEQDDSVVVYGCRFPHAPSVLRSRRPSHDDLTLDAVLYRWQFDLSSGTVKEGPIDDVPVEFPRINDSQLGRRTQIGYTTSFTNESATFLKYDLRDGSSVRHELGPGRVAGESVFVARGDGNREDDGYCIAFVHDQNENQSELVIIDSRDFARAPLARVLLPQKVPAGFHGIWIAHGGRFAT